jgi:hypothetical protein
VGIARFVKVFSVFVMSVLVRCANMNVSIRLRSVIMIAIGRDMSAFVFVGPIVIMITAIIVSRLFVQFVAMCYA